MNLPTLKTLATSALDDIYEAIRIAVHATGRKFDLHYDGQLDGRVQG